MQSAIGDQLARALLAGEIADGDQVVVDVDQGADSLTIRPAAEAASQA
jgi:ATP-dependent Clp protease ATP-binding subunit ClpB